MSKEINFERITRRFDMNISALRVFTNPIGQLAEEHDKNITSQRNSAFAQLIGVSVEDLDILKGISNNDLQLALKAQMQTGIAEQENRELETTPQLTEEQKVVIQKMAQANSKEFLSKSRIFFCHHRRYFQYKRRKTSRPF